MNIIRSTNKTPERFEALDEENVAGFMAYHWEQPGIMIIDHTEVNAAYGGQGVGKKLVMAAVTDAREKGYKIFPVCEFAKSVFDRKHEIQDVLSKK
ncbi:MAG: N-acetyltransferase [Niastella sp.]|nr:N-acetyltransferase [Niastella sp.]